MTALAAHPAFKSESPVLEGISWQTYEVMLRELDAAGKRLRVTYDRGRMVVMSPLPIHEKWKQLMGRLTEVLAEHRDIPISAYGSTTWKRERLLRGLEADQCYYVQRLAEIRGKLDIDLESDPPPDLAVEVNVTHHPLDRLAIYASLQIPEIWSYDGKDVDCLHLTSGSYKQQPTSLAFPGFEPAKLQPFLALHPRLVDSEIVKAFREWLEKSS
jgi:Uma2 family endonuclease